MKKFLVVSGSIFFLSCTVVLAQRGRVKETSSPVSTISQHDIDISPFSKGKWEFAVARQDLGYSHQNIKANDVSQGSQSQFKFDASTNYFVANNFGIGLELNANLGTMKNNYTSTSDKWMTYGNFTYGKTVGDNFNFYARAGIGVGGLTSKYTPVNGNTTTDKTNLFGYKFDVGFPIRLGNEPVYLTPEIDYHYLHEKFDGGTETDNHFDFCLDFEAYLFCHEMRCDSHSGYSFSRGLYDQGHSYFGVDTRGRLDFGTLKTVYDNNFPSEKQDYSKEDFSANYMYYIVKDVALGVDLDYGNSVYKNSGNTTYKQSNMSFTFEPMLEINLPVQEHGWNNLFLMGGYGFGSTRSEFINGNTTSTTKYSTTDYCVGLGYNFLFTKSLSFTPAFQYAGSTSKNKDTDLKYKYNGPQIEMGVKKFFGR